LYDLQKNQAANAQIFSKLRTLRINPRPWSKSQKELDFAGHKQVDFLKKTGKILSEIKCLCTNFRRKYI